MVLIEYGLPFTILTKGGTRAVRDFDLLEGYDLGRFGTTSVFMDQKEADHWDPGAATVKERIQAIQEAHSRGIKTWVSVEPIIEPDQALEVIRELHPIVGHWKVGKINHWPEIERRHNWVALREEAKSLLNDLGAKFYLKKSLTE